MNTDHSQPLGHPHNPLSLSINKRLLDLERERLRLVAKYDEIMTRVEDGDDTGFSLTQISQRLSDVNREIERARSR